MSITSVITKWNFQVTSPHQIPHALAKAFHIAKNGRPGPVLIDITKDAQLGVLDFEYFPFDEKRSYPVLEEHLCKRAAELINRASQPYLIRPLANAKT